MVKESSYTCKESKVYRRELKGTILFCIKQKIHNQSPTQTHSKGLSSTSSTPFQADISLQVHNIAPSPSASKKDTKHTQININDRQGKTVMTSTDSPLPEDTPESRTSTAHPPSFSSISPPPSTSSLLQPSPIICGPLSASCFITFAAETILRVAYCPTDAREMAERGWEKVPPDRSSRRQRRRC